MVIDLAAVRFVDPCTLGAVTHWIRRLHADRRIVRLRRTPGPVARLARLAGVDQLAAAATSLDV